MKKLLFKQRSDTPHWVGDGFPVRSVFNYNEFAEAMSPFLLMDYIGPSEFAPSQATHRLGVGEHPHRGFETVTLVYSGEVEHRDSAGGGGIIRSGDVQWMTAGSGLVHEEFHGKKLAQDGGVFHGVQIWVNLPKQHKMTKPKYQGIASDRIPVIKLPHEAGTARIIAGDFQGTQGAASTFSPVNLWDLRLGAGKTVELRVPAGHNTAVFVSGGSVRVNHEQLIEDAELGLFDKEGEVLTLTAESDAMVLFLGGEPLREPVVGYGPFVMNSSQEIVQAIKDFETGKMGTLSKA
ncbi:MAG TPA: pirin family protein [Oligoflexus sp.]|uniref:pirin family protein n=1 Tax=Oligoflexus sp. TaxID=1971216 RepID=UPI002D32F59D|nr:pirin family protein [Oligoflexus sp.]HYX37690.1 pirin family protein [Oligoflexus sp.]